MIYHKQWKDCEFKKENIRNLFYFSPWQKTLHLIQRTKYLTVNNFLKRQRHAFNITITLRCRQAIFPMNLPNIYDYR